jgi:hypothetical protein
LGQFVRFGLPSQIAYDKLVRVPFANGLARKEAAVYITGVLEYALCEIILVAGDNAAKTGSDRIAAANIQAGVGGDPELTMFMNAIHAKTQQLAHEATRQKKRKLEKSKSKLLDDYKHDLDDRAFALDAREEKLDAREQELGAMKQDLVKRELAFAQLSRDMA